jgi:hypothetical protein
MIAAITRENEFGGARGCRSIMRWPAIPGAAISNSLSLSLSLSLPLD